MANTISMEPIYADVELINAIDLLSAKCSTVEKGQPGKVRLKVIVNSGAWMMAINETIQEQLQLEFIERRKAQMASGEVVEYDVVGPLMVKFANRTATCSAFVLPGDSEPLLGAIPMEEMDVLIHPLRQELIVNSAHPNYAQLKMK